MKKTLIALAVLGAAAGTAYAQSNVTIYGIVDTGYIKETGRDLRMGELLNNRIGFMGSEDLGGGLKATFKLEKRFDLFNGTSGNTTGYYRNSYGPGADKDWDGQSAVGLQSSNWGHIQFGRVYELLTQSFNKFDPFMQFGVGTSFYSTLRSVRVDNSVRYDSPSWGGFTFGLLYSLGRDTSRYSTVNWTGAAAGTDNDGYGINFSYNNGPWMGTANWSRVQDSNNSYTWNVAGSYKFANQLRLMAFYERSHDKGWLGNQSQNVPSASARSKQQNALVGIEWDIGPGQFDASVNWAKVSDAAGTRAFTAAVDSGHLWKLSLGYTYNLSKRTSIYGAASYTDFSNEQIGNFYYGMNRESVTGLQVGMNHKF